MAIVRKFHYLGLFRPGFVICVALEIIQDSVFYKKHKSSAILQAFYVGNNITKPE
jgi:hypothetical protein